MDDIHGLPNLDDSELYDINRVRIFLKVTTLSDIADAAGILITAEAFNALQLTDRTSPLKWPRQFEITPKQKKLWQKALESAYTTEGRNLHNHMGQWIRQSNQTWNTLCHPLERIITYEEQGARRQYKICCMTRRAITAAPVDPDLEVSTAWPKAIPATVISKAEYQITVRCAEITEEPDAVAEKEYHSFVEYIKDQEQLTGRLLRQFEFTPGGERTLEECLRNNKKLRAASDGSLDPELRLASFGWLLLGNGNVLVRGSGPVDGIPDLLSSTRAELFGYGGIVEFLHHFCKFYNIDDLTSKVQTWIDNRAAIR